MTFGELLADTLRDAEQIGELPLYVVSKRKAIELAETVMAREVIWKGKERESAK